MVEPQTLATYMIKYLFPILNKYKMKIGKICLSPQDFYSLCELSEFGNMSKNDFRKCLDISIKESVQLSKNKVTE